MRGNLSKKEQDILALWKEENLEEKQQRARKGCEKFILHDGPPYANGHIHLGHALNKILKDIINRWQWMCGKNTVFVPGWDCHGLPIEWKIEEFYKKKGLEKKMVPPGVFRKACREFAQKWQKIQWEELQRLGLMGKWDTPYLTMDFKAQARIAGDFLDLVMKGYVYQGVRPVLWSAAEETVLAEAEVEYHDKTSFCVMVRFLWHTRSFEGLGAPFPPSVVIWTTTPWTLPSNQAVAYHPDLSYVVIQVTSLQKDSLVCLKEIFAVGKNRLDFFCQKSGIQSYTLLQEVKGQAFATDLCDHPFASKGYTRPVPLIPGLHVTDDAGTGFVHIAPDHGAEDFCLGKEFNLLPLQSVCGKGRFQSHMPYFSGQSIDEATHTSLALLMEEKKLAHQETTVHAYPHSWRSKAPLITRVTAQWFVKIDEHQLREKALHSLQSIQWIPTSSKERLASMLSGRPDWCVSRQRMWGVPLTLFVNKKTLEPLQDAHVNRKIIETIAQEGVDVWFDNPSQRFLSPFYPEEDFEPVYDILDVWFDSGTTHNFVLQDDGRLQDPADLYLEGSDQHRGWFQSSLLTSLALKGRPPFKAVYTHGFTLDNKGRKMSKSLQNTLSPQKITETLGADILRLWVASTNSQEDMRLGDQALQQTQDLYRRFRNTFRYLLGALEDQCLDPSPQLFPELETWMCHHLYVLHQQLIQCYEAYQFQEVVQILHRFCSVDLSAFYFDIRKDALYCDAQTHPSRQGVQGVFCYILSFLSRWLAPILCFTTEEVWQLWKKASSSIHLEAFPSPCETWNRPDLGEKYRHVRKVRRVITGALERARSQGFLKSSLEASCTLYCHPDFLQHHNTILQTTNWEEISIVSKATVVAKPPPEESFSMEDMPGMGVVVQKAPGHKCDRCWKFSYHVKENTGNLCHRCQEVVTEVATGAEKNT